MSSGVTENLACRERGERAKGIIMLNQKNMDVWVKGHGISALSWKQENMDKKKGTKNDLRIAFCFLFVHMLLHDRDLKNHLHSYGNLSVTCLIIYASVILVASQKQNKFYFWEKWNLWLNN